MKYPASRSTTHPTAFKEAGRKKDFLPTRRLRQVTGIGGDFEL